jgi:tetraacyldisaccharide 4'-kinase
MPFLYWTRLRNFLYDKSILKISSFSPYVISVGNLSWGGTGKTSIVILIAKFLISRGLHVAVLSRGYRRNTSGVLLVNDPTGIQCGWEECGDEAYLIAHEIPDAIVVVAEKRSDGMQFLERRKPDVVLLDDAFQHRGVNRDFDLVLIDASEDLTKQKVIPFGKLREEPGSLKRADAVVLTHFKHANSATLNWVNSNVVASVFRGDYIAENGAEFRGKKVGALCAIGAPDQFFHLLQEQGAEIVEKKAYRDHHNFTPQEIQDFLRKSREQGAESIVITAKDAVRMKPEWFDPPFHVLRVKLLLEEESLFFEFILNAMNRVAAKH